MTAIVSNLSAYWINPPASIEIKLRNPIAVTMARATLECTWRVAGCLVVERERMEDGLKKGGRGKAMGGEEGGREEGKGEGGEGGGGGEEGGGGGREG